MDEPKTIITGLFISLGGEVNTTCAIGTTVNSMNPYRSD